MQAELCGVTLHYEQYGHGDRHVLMLHGWGCEIKHFAPIADSLQSDYHITVIDFPAHGQSTPPPQPWGVADFAACVKALILQLGIAPCDIIAHSFGGRVALYLAANEPQLVKRLVLTGCAGIKKPQTPEQQKRSARYQRLKGLYQSLGRVAPFKGLSDRLLSELRQKYGSPDYNALSEDMKKTFVKVVNEDLSPLLPRVQASTLLVWGENDTATPLSDAEIIKNLIPDSGLCVIKGTGHYSFCEKPYEVAAILRSFIK